jgi:hypothetical protein
MTLFFLAVAAFQLAAADQNGQITQAAPATPQHPVSKAGLPGITIEASRERQAVRSRVNKFVAAVIVRPSDETLMRWDTPICPLVAGLPKAWGEFILEHISQAAVRRIAP